MNTPFRIALLATLVTLGACSDPRKVESHLTGAGMADTTASASTRPNGNQPHLVDVAMRELPDFTALVEQYGDAVVNVRIIGHASAGDSTEDALQERDLRLCGRLIVRGALRERGQRLLRVDLRQRRLLGRDRKSVV